MKILLDMNLAPRWVLFLRNAGFEAQHWSEIGPANASDKEIMSYAAENAFIVLTHDLDFSAILAATQGNKPSVVQIRAQETTPERIGTQVVAALRHAGGTGRWSIINDRPESNPNSSSPFANRHGIRRGEFSLEFFMSPFAGFC